jgi:NAD+ kinase
VRVGLVVHPTRPVEGALATLERWTRERGIELVQLATDGGRRRVAPPGTVSDGDLVVAMGGDGTVLSALRAAAAGGDGGPPVLGIACGSLGALTAVATDGLAAVLDRFQAGDWRPWPVPALTIEGDAGLEDWALNDFVMVRRGAGQLAVDVMVGDELYVRLSGDGVVVATALGSTAYSMAAGGPILTADTPAFVCTPLAMHGGSAPSVVVPADAVLTLEAHPGYAGFEVEVDGHRRSTPARRFRVAWRAGRATLVTFGAPTRGLTGLRRRRLVADSPRILARDERGT